MYKYLSWSSLKLESSFGLQIGNPKWRYKDLENRRHAGLGQEASSGLNKNRRYADLNTRRHAGLENRRQLGPQKRRRGNVVPEN